MSRSKGVFGQLGRISIGPILWTAVLVRIVLLIIHHHFYPLPQSADARGFERRAWALSAGQREPFLEYVAQGGSQFLAYLGSLVYDLVGQEPFVLGLLMILPGVGLVYLVYRAVLELTGSLPAARVAALCAAFFPQLPLHSVLFLREIPFAFFLALGMWGAVRFLKRQSLPGLFVFAVSSLAATLFHTGAIVAIPGLLLGILLAGPRPGRGRFSRYAVKGFAIMVLLGAVLVMDRAGWGLGKFGGGLESAMEVFETAEMRGTMGGAAYPEWLRIRGGLTNEAWKVPIRYAAFLFSPLIPFLVRTPGHLIGLLDAVLYVAMFALFLRHWRLLLKDRALLALLVMGLTLAFVFALGVSNFGTAIRHRAKFVTVFISVAVALHALAKARAAVPVEADRFGGLRNVSSMPSARPIRTGGSHQSY